LLEIYAWKLDGIDFKWKRTQNRRKSRKIKKKYATRFQELCLKGDME
jgi:hypothetical protein